MSTDDKDTLVDQTRRTILAAAATAPLAVASSRAQAQAKGGPTSRGRQGPFWPNGARLAVSVTMMLEADGGQDNAWQKSPDGSRTVPNFFQFQSYSYGATEGMSRILDVLDRRRIKGTSFMIGSSIETYPDLAREIVARGHEAGGRGRFHRSTAFMSEAEEREFLRAGFESYKRVLGTWPKGFNAQGLQSSVNTNTLLKELGLIYTIDDQTRDEPWIEILPDGSDFLRIPYKQNVNDIDFFQFTRRPLADWEQHLRQEFEVLYREGEGRRRMMSVPLHDRLAGFPSISRTTESFLEWAKKREGVWFARRDEIAEWVLGQGRALTPRVRPTMPPPLS